MDAAVIAAVCTGVGGIITSYAAVIHARHQGSEECEDRLRVARAEAEDVTAELHALRLRDQGGIDWLWLLAVAMFGAAVIFGSIGLSVEKQGPPGPPGPPGSTGSTGERGPAGPAATGGTSGTGQTGAQGVPGQTGAAGSAATGPPGPQGPPGAAVTGPQGDPGQTGARGASGQPGARGAPGATGATGPRGTPGPTCPTGTQLHNVIVKTDRGGQERILACVPFG
jgi:hypothetical protein